MAFPDNQRRQDAHDIVAARHGEQPMLVSQMRDKGTAVRFQSDTQHQPPAAHTFEQCVMVRDKLLQTGAEPLSHLLHMLGKVRLKDHVKHCVARRHRERIAAIGRTMRSKEHTSELQSLMRISYAVFCLEKKTTKRQ